MIEFDTTTHIWAAVIILALSSVSLSACSEGQSQTAGDRPTIDDCGKLGEGERCPKACFAPAVESATIKQYSPRPNPSELRVRASKSDQTRLSELYSNDLGPRKITLRSRAPDADGGSDTSRSALPTDQPHVHIGQDGFEVTIDGEALPPLDGCPPDGPTVCNRDPDLEITDRARDAARLARERSLDKSGRAVDSIVDLYDWRGLYNALMTLKQQRPASSFIVLSADENLPYALLIRAADVARTQLEAPTYETAAAFQDAAPKTVQRDGKRQQAALFPRPIISWR